MPDTHTGSTAQAVLEAVGAAQEPLAVLRRGESAFELDWANYAFFESARADLADLADTDLTTVITSPFGELPLNDVRVSTFPCSVVASDASVTHWEVTAVPALDVHQRVWVLSFRPRTPDRNLDELLRASEERFRALAERAPIGIFSSDVGLRLAYVNDFLADLLGVPAARLLGTSWMSFVAEADLDGLCAGLQGTLAGHPFEAPARFLTCDGEERWVNVRAVPVEAPGSPGAFLGTVEDVTERKRFEEALAWQAMHDPLTQLPNRMQLGKEIAEALEQRPDDVVVLFFDLDDFKHINDSLGHQAGDELLVTVATRLRAAVREGDHVFRFGGDEFVVLSHGTSDDEALGVANRLRRAVAQPIVLEGQEFVVKCSVGVVRPTEGTTPVELVRDADVAMYQAKRNGKSAAALFDVALRDERDQELRLVGATRDAIEARRMSLEYQPILDVETAEPVAVEALLRWNDDEWLEVDPGVIVATAEAAGAITDLNELVIDQACADLAAWRANGYGPRWVSLNMSPAQVRAPGMVDHLARSIVTHRLAGSDISVEIAEEAWVTADGTLDEIVAELRALGARLVLDDVGATLSSLSSLATAPVDAIKLDPTFLYGSSPGNEVIARAVIGVAREFGLEVVAEGIEDVDRAELARVVGATLAQGYALGHPTIAAAVPAIFARAEAHTHHVTTEERSES